MATYQQRPNGAVTAKVRRAGFPAQSRTFLSKADAVRWATEVEADMSRACFVDTRAAESTLFEHALSRYLSEVTPAKKGAVIEAIRLRALMRDPVAQYSLATLTGRVLAEWRDRRLQTVSGSTVNRDLNLISHVLEVARKDWGIALTENAAQQLRRPASNVGRSRRLAENEQALLLYAARKARVWWLAPMIELAIHTAMRQGEVRGLEWGTIDLQRRVLILEAAATKTNTLRAVPLNPRALAVLTAIHEKQGQPRSGPVFEGVTRDAVKLAFRRARQRAGLHDFRLHDARHEATSRLFEAGLSAVEVASVTGHKTLSMLQRYTHLDAAKLAAKLADLQPDKN